MCERDEGPRGLEDMAGLSHNNYIGRLRKRTPDTLNVDFAKNQPLAPEWIPQIG